MTEATLNSSTAAMPITTATTTAKNTTFSTITRDNNNRVLKIVIGILVPISVISIIMGLLGFRHEIVKCCSAQRQMEELIPPEPNRNRDFLQNIQPAGLNGNSGDDEYLPVLPTHPETIVHEYDDVPTP